MGFFNIAKGNNSNKNQKFITPSMGDIPQQNNNGMNSGMNGNNETFVYNSVPVQGYINNNQNMQNNYPTNNMNQNYSNNNYTGYNNGIVSNQGNVIQGYNNANNQNYNNQGYNANNGMNNGGYKQNEQQATIMPRSVQPPKVKQEETFEELDMPDTIKNSEIESLDEKEESKPELDALNNGTNPEPVNPVAPKDDIITEEDLPEDAKANIFSVLGMMLGMILTPGTTIIKNSKKYRSISKAMIVTLLVSFISILLCMAARIVVGMFSVTYNSVTGASSVSLTFANILNLDNYTPYIIVALIMSLGAICIASIVYYASSFLNSKGVHMGTYFMVSSLAMVPVIIGVLVLYPILNVFSQYAAIFAFVFTFLYTLISFYIGMNEVLVFGNINKRILYNVINLSLIFIIIVIIFLLSFRLNILVPPTFYI